MSCLSPYPMNKVITALTISILLLIPQTASLDVDLSGGAVPTKSHAIWQLYQYKYTTLLRMKPLIWCPYKAYTLIDRYVHVYGRGNENWISVDADLIALTKEDADFNKHFAKQFAQSHLKAKSRKKQVRRIYNYCRKTKYVIHTKYARDVFTKREGDCAGIASAFYVLCKAKGIPVRYVIGWDGNACHAWNRVKLSKRWYWIDATAGKWLKRKQYSGRTVMEMW